MSFTPHTEHDIREMLDSIGIENTQQLFDEIPPSLIAKPFNSHLIPEALSEMEAVREFTQRAARDQVNLNFIGAGAYEHHIPAAVWELTSRGEFLTAYTPYQPEASQGTLQVIFEYQTMMSSLMGLEVSNASLYDGASALAEAILMAVRANKNSKSQTILLPQTLHPFYRATVETLVKQQKINLIEIPYDQRTGKTDLNALAAYQNQDITALVIPQPNFFGVLEDVDTLVNWSHEQKSLAIAVVNPMAMALLKEPGAWGKQGVDIACGDGQPLGIPLASGGPYFGFLTCRSEFVRQMPGRIVGETTDQDGRRGFVLTLQAREQHIRRSKATSNICTNQGLLMTAATIYMSLMGPEGLKKIALSCYQQTQKLMKHLQALPNVRVLFNQPHFHEFILQLPMDAEQFLKKMAKKGIQAGYNLASHYPELERAILINVTETKTDSDIAQFINCLNECIEDPSVMSHRQAVIQP